MSWLCDELTDTPDVATSEMICIVLSGALNSTHSTVRAGNDQNDKLFIIQVYTLQGTVISPVSVSPMRFYRLVSSPSSFKTVQLICIYVH